MNRFRTFGLVLACAAVTAPVFGQDPMAAAAPAQGDAFSMKRVVKVGDTLKYKLTGDFDLGGQQIGFSANVTEKVTEVTTDGSFKVSSEQSDAKINMNGADQDLPNQGGPNVTTYNAAGVVQEIKGDQSEAGAYRMATLSSVPAPTQAVKVGEGWTYKTTANSKTGTVAATSDFKVLGTEKIGEEDTVKLSVSIKEDEGTDKAANEGTVWLDSKDFSLVKSDTKWTNAPIPGAPAPINGKVLLTKI